MHRFVLLLTFIFPLFVHSWNHPVDHVSGEEIKAYMILGERKSGTNYLRHLITENIPSLVWREQWHKHIVPWVDLDDEKVVRANQGEYSIFPDSLYIYIVRNPYDWVRSLFRNAYDSKIDNEDFDVYISHPWYNSWREDILNPYTGRVFENVFSMRDYKIKSLLKWSQRVQNFLIVRYEDIATEQGAQEFMLFLKELVKLDFDVGFTPVNYHKFNKDRKFIQKPYRLLTLSQHSLINESLDWEVEETIGYSKTSLFRVNTSYFR